MARNIKKNEFELIAHLFILITKLTKNEQIMIHIPESFNAFKVKFGFGNPAKAYNPNHTRAECREYLTYTRCAYKAYQTGSDVKDCPFPSHEQTMKCCPINPKFVTVIVKFDSNGPQAAPLVTQYAFKKYYQSGSVPNPN